MLLLATTLTVALVAAPPRDVAVVDVSRPDAVYGDVSGALAEDAAAALADAGLSAARVDEATQSAVDPAVPGVDRDGLCRSGPCLAALARRMGVRALVLLDAGEEEPPAVEVALMALDASSGRPLASRRYRAGRGAPRALRRFAAELARLLHPPDGG